MSQELWDSQSDLQSDGQSATHWPEDDTYDVIIIGARIAGAATAALLAQQGARVLLLERATFPAPTISCPVFFGNSMAVLERIGVIDAVEAIDAPQIRYYGSRSPQLDLVARLPASHGRDYAYSMRREVIDTAILKRVRTYANITLREGFNVTGLIWGAGQVVGVRGRQHGAAEESLYAHAVVGADGKRSLVARAVNAPIYDAIKGESCLFYAYYHNVTPLDEPSSIVYLAEERRTAALAFDADDGLTVVSALLPAEQFDHLRKDPEGTLQSVWRSIPELARRCRHATRATPVMGQGPTDSFYRQSYGPGWALVGDAGHYIDPITGQGINNALRSAELFTEAWIRTRRRTAWKRAMAGYQRQRDAETHPMYNLIRFSMRMQPAVNAGLDFWTPLFQAIARNPDMTSQYIGIFNGATPVNGFFHPLNLARMMLQDRLRMLNPQSHTLFKPTAQHI